MTCRFFKLGSDITLWCCDPMESLHRTMEALCIREYEQHELELDLERQREIENEEPIVVEPEVIPYAAISDWDVCYELQMGDGFTDDT